MRLISILMFLIMIFSTLYMNYSILRTVSAVVILVLFFSFLLSKKKIEFKYNLLILIMVFFFTFISLLSALFNSDYELLLGALILLIIFLTFNVVFPSLAGFKSNELVYKSVLYSHIPIIFFPLIQGIERPPYSGIFDNPNSFGIACVTLFAVVVSKFSSRIHGYIFCNKKIRKRALLFYLLILPALLFLTIYSGSRTSFLTAATILLAAGGLIILSFFKRATKKQFLKGIRLGFYMTFLSTIVFIIFPIKEKFEEVILYKFRLKASDTLSERGYVWESTIRDSSTLGNGRDYFTGFEHAAHNTFISLLGQYGWLPTIFFLIIMLSFLLISIQYSFKAINDQYRYLPIILLISFLVLSIGEGMLFKGAMIGAFASAGAATTLIKSQQIKSDKKMVVRERKKKFKKLYGVNKKLEHTVQ